MLNEGDVVFLLDVDDTLLDNDRFAADLDAHLAQAFGVDERARYWAIYDELRKELSFVDYLGALNRFRVGLDDRPQLLQMSSFILDYPFADLLYPHALDSIAHLEPLGATVVLSDGDVVLQPRKVQRSGIWNAVAGRVMIVPHKERALGVLRNRYPARRYVMIDDKAPLLAAMKRVLGESLTTVFVRQGHYARQFDDAAAYAAIDPAPDLAIDRIADVLDRDPSDFIASHGVAVTQQERT
jgi:FMN phosphatase YigB (HAD superfamily)